MFLKNFFTFFEGFFYLFLRKVAICTQISACFPQDVHTSIPTGSKKKCPQSRESSNDRRHVITKNQSNLRRLVLAG